MAALLDGGTTKRADFDPGRGNNSAFTIFGWFKRTSAVDFSCTMGYGINGGGGPSLAHLELTSSSPVGNEIFTGGTGTTGGVAPLLTNGVWQSRCLTWDGGTAGANGAGILWAGNSKIITATLTPQVGQQQMFFGRGGATNCINGKMALLYMWDVVLSDAQIIAQCKQQAPITNTSIRGYWKCIGDLLDSSGNGNTLNNNGSIAFDADVPKFGNAGGGFFAACSKFAGRALKTVKRRFHPVLLPDGYRRRPSGLLVPA